MFDEVKKQLDHIVLEFQLRDIERALAHAQANFLAAQGLMICTEFLGGIGNGTLGNEDPGKAKPRFKAGLDLLGAQYSGSVDELWSTVRCGLLHSYLPKGNPGRDYWIINDSKAAYGFRFTRDPDTGRDQLVVNPAIWLQDLRTAYTRLLESLKTDPQKLAKAVECLERLPGLG
jgi:hypothetical protein